ncbi:MAG TPA: aminopeptidase P N-terminal domain-containing protein [Gemmatimonadales bacterium]|jgi:Xaa-Pro aminopeptidase|nr:aminopeptidase P N-terminal domain-containing protein [Gemmatimonadales bacterium]
MRSLILAVCVAAPALAAQGRPSPAPPPLGAWTPVPELPGMGRPVDTATVAARRRVLLARLGRGVALVPAAHERELERDYVQDNDFRQSNTFFYFTELETQDAWLLLVAGGAGETVLFLPPRDPLQERWTGLRLGPDTTAVRLTGIARVLPTDSLDPVLSAALVRARGPLYVPLDQTTRDEPRFRDLLFSGRDVRNLRPSADSMRLVKDADEIGRMRKAVDISVLGHVAAMQAARPGAREYEIEAALEAEFRRNGADRVGYPSIVGSGPNSTTLHYDVNRRQTRDGDLIVVDAGAEWGQYTADVTRTFPVNGKFTPRQKAIYDLVLATQQAAFDSTRPGTTIAQLNRVARDYMRTHSGTLCGAQTCDAYFIHGLSHWLGMDVHDVGDYSTPLKAGMVLTIEPGIYLAQEALGVRIEDDVLVTATGAEWLSAKAPKTTAEIERLMGRR